MDEAGELLFQTVRFDPKGFMQRRPDPAREGEWISNLDGVRRVLYRLPELAGQLVVWIPEGERDVDTLRAHGLAATTNPMGAGKWSDAYAHLLVAAGVREVNIPPDKDQAGEKHALEVARSCYAAGLEVRLVRLPGLPERGDVSDWLDGFAQDADALRAIAEATPRWEPEPPRQASVSPPEPAAEAPAAWPALTPAALYGLAGRVVHAIEPYSEADPVAILAHVHAGVGCLLGRGPHALVGHDRHPGNEYMVLVGRSAKGRKGTAWSTPREMLRRIDEPWARGRIRTGLSSGEGLIYHVRDPRDEKQPIKKRGGRVEGYQSVRVDDGEPDKRLLVIEPELASVLRRMQAESNSLSAVLRAAWDDGDLSTLTKNSPLRATGAHVSIVAHVTQEELVASLTDMDRANGFANRFLFFLVRRSKFLPHGAEVPPTVLDPLIEELREVVHFAEGAGTIRRDPEATDLWATIYPKLSEGEQGLTGAILARAEAHVLRLSVLYAVLDCSSLVRPEHLQAALALWDYAETSARIIFGKALGIQGADRLLDAIKTRGPMTREQIRDVFSRNRSAGEIDALVRVLEEAGKIRCSTRPPEGGRGRPVTIYELVDQESGD